MADQQTKHTAPTVTSGLQARDVSIRTQTIIWPASTFVTTWTLGSSSDPTESPVTVAPASNSNSAGQSVGPILSGVVAFIVLVLVAWVCCRRNRSNGRSRRSSRRHGSSYTSKGGSSGSPSSNGSSRNGASVGSTASEAADNHWDQAEQVPEAPMPDIPPPVAGGWPGQQPDPGIRMGPAQGQGMGFPPGRGGPQPMMGRGGPPLVGRGGPPPMMSRGGPPPGALQ